VDRQPGIRRRATARVWPGLDGRPDIVHSSRDWLTKLHLVAAGCGLTTVPPVLAAAAPPGVRVLPCAAARKNDAGSSSPTSRATCPEPALRVVEALRAASDAQAS